MTLQFDPSPYLEAFKYGRNVQNQNTMAPLKSASELGDTVGQIGQGITQYQQLQRQKQMDALHQQLLQGQVNAQNTESSPLVPTGSQSPGNAFTALSLPGNAPGAPSMPSFQGLSSQSSGVSAPYSTPDFSSLMPNTYPSNQQQTNATPAPSGLFHMQPDGSMGGGSPGSGPSPIVAAHKQFLSSKFGGGGQTAQAPSQPQPMFSGGATNPQPSDPEAIYQKILLDPKESPIRQKMAFEALQRITEEEKTPYEKKGWQLGIDKTKAETGKFTAEGTKAQAEADMLKSPGGGYKVQNQLEQQGRDLATKIINSRSGDFGIQNQKVSQAIHLRSLLDQYKQTDPRTGEVTYNVPNSQYSELAVGLANLLSNGGQAAESTIHSIRQASAIGDINQALTYAGFDPKLLGGSTQGILKNLSESIDRQGMVSQKLREPVLNQIRQQMPTMLNPDVKERIINSLGVNKYEDYMNGGQGPGTTTPKQGGSQPAKQFNSIQEAQAANLPPGTRIQIGTRMATVH